MVVKNMDIWAISGDYQDIEAETRENYTGRWGMEVEDKPLADGELKEKMSESYLSE